MSASESTCRILVGFDLEFLKSSWLRTTIERSAIDAASVFWKEFEKSFLIHLATSLVAPKPIELESFDDHSLDASPSLIEPASSPQSDPLNSQAFSWQSVLSATHAFFHSIFTTITTSSTRILKPSTSIQFRHLMLGLLVAINLSALVYLFVLEERFDTINRTAPTIFSPSDLDRLPRWWFDAVLQDRDRHWENDQLMEVDDLIRASVIPSTQEHAFVNDAFAATKDSMNHVEHRLRGLTRELFMRDG